MHGKVILVQNDFVIKSDEEGSLNESSLTVESQSSKGSKKQEDKSINKEKKAFRRVLDSLEIKILAIWQEKQRRR